MIDDNGIIRELTAEEEAEMSANRVTIDEPSTAEKIAELEAQLEALKKEIGA